MDLQEQEFTNLLLQWNNYRGAQFQLRECDLQWNLSEQELVAYKILDCVGVPVLMAVATSLGAAHGIPTKTLWLSLFGNIPSGKEAEFVAELEEIAKRSGKTRIAIGADEFHFLPGLIEEGDNQSRLKTALMAAGFQGADAVDFMGSVKSTLVLQAAKAATVQALKDGWTFEDAISSDELDSLDKFLLQEFPGRWRREFIFWRQRTDTLRASWAVLKKGDQVLGFARYAIRGRVPQLSGWTPGALRFPISDTVATWENTDACLGPIGMAASERGKGLGKMLLGLTLQRIIDQNAEQLCIDWTNAYNYYMPLGFEVGRKYWTCWKNST